MTSTSDDALRGRDEEHGELLLLTIEYLRLFPAFPVNFFLHLVEARCSGKSIFNIKRVCSPRSPFLFRSLKSSRSERFAWSFRQKTQLASQLDSSSWLFNFISQLIRQNQFQEGLQIQRSAAAFPVQLCRKMNESMWTCARHPCATHNGAEASSHQSRRCQEDM